MLTDPPFIPIKQGLYEITETAMKTSILIGCECLQCGEIFFPNRQICQNCQSINLKQIILSRTGKIYSFTIVMQQPGSLYKGSVPYALGWVELPEGVRIETLYTGCELQELFIGMEVELVIEELYENDEGNKVVCHKFRPIQK